MPAIQTWKQQKKTSFLHCVLLPLSFRCLSGPFFPSHAETSICQCQKQETKILPHLSFFRVHIFHINLSSQHTAAQHAHEQCVLADLSVRDWGAQWWLLLAILKVVSIIKYYTNNITTSVYIYINSFTTGIALPCKEGSSLHLLCEYETLCWVNASLW